MTAGNDLSEAVFFLLVFVDKMLLFCYNRYIRKQWGGFGMHRKAVPERLASHATLAASIARSAGIYVMHGWKITGNYIEFHYSGGLTICVMRARPRTYYLICGLWFQIFNHTRFRKWQGMARRYEPMSWGKILIVPNDAFLAATVDAKTASV